MSRKVCGVTTGARVPSKMSLGQLDGTRMVAMVTQPIGEERGRLEDDSHADTCLLGKGWRLVHDRGHSCQVEGFSADVGTLSLPIVDAVTVAETTEGKEVLIQINQALWKPDEDHSLLSSFQCRYSGTRLDNVPMSQDDRSEYGIVIDSDEHGRVVLPFNLKDSSTGFAIRTPDDEDLNTRPLFEITSQLPWDPNSPEHAEEERKAQLKRDFAANDRVLITSEPKRKGETRRVNLSSLWTRSTDDYLVSAIDPADGTSETDVETSSDSGGSSSSSDDGDDAMSSESNGRRRLSRFKVKQSSSSVVRRLKKLRRVNMQRTKHSYKQDAHVKAFYTADRKPKVSAEQLAKLWEIGIDKAQHTIDATTQQSVRTFDKPFSRRLRTPQALYRRNHFRGIVYTDTMMSGVKSIRGNTCAQLMVTDFYDVTLYPLKSKRKAHVAMDRYFIDRGVPTHIHSDNAKEMTTSGKWKKCLEERGGIKATTTEPESPFQNNAEREIRLLQSQALRLLQKKNASLRLWDDCFEYVAECRSRTARPNDLRLEGRVPRELIESNTVDISEWVQHGWYDDVWYWEPGSNPDKGERLGRIAGVASDVGQAMCYRIIPVQSKLPMARFQYLSRSTVRPVLPEERATDEYKARIKELDESIARLAGNPATIAEIEEIEKDYLWYGDRQSAEFSSAFKSPEPVEPEASMPDQDDAPTPEETDEYINVQVLLPRGDGYQRAKIEKRKRTVEGELIGQRHSNPVLDTRGYVARFPDGTCTDVSANVVAASLFDNCDENGNEFRMLKEIIDHRSDETAVAEDDGWIRRKANRPRERRKTTRGWQLLVEWIDGTQTWEPLSELKESYPMEICDYAYGNKISHQPAFAWWVPAYLKEKRRILSKVKKRYWKRTHKFGVELPKSAEEAYALDKKNGNTLWADAIALERENSSCAFEVLPEGAPPPRGYKKIGLNMVFDVKMGENLRRKARYCARGDQIETPPSMTYASVVSRDSVRICLMLAALNGLDVKCADVQNAYLNAEPRENVYTIAGKEWGALEGRVVVIVRSLYGLKSAGAAWAAALRQVMRDLGFFPCRADGDVWMRASVDTTFGGERSLGATNDQGQPDGHWYYEYVLIHTDDILSISKHPGKIMEAIGSVYKLKEDRKTRLQWDDPDLYLGSKVRKYRTPEDEEDLDCPLGYCWSTSGDDYVKSVIEDIQAKLGKDGRQLNANQCSPVSSGYRPELDTSPELVGDSISDFQEVIGCLRWAIELGRGDIATEVALLSRHLALPRRGHLEQAYNVVAYLKKHPYSKLVMDPTPQGHKDRYAKRFNTDADWFEFYGDVKEEIPLDAPKPMGKPVEITAYCDADHAGDKLTRRSHTGILIFLMSAPILWYSKRQATIESSTFGSEIVALRTCLELIKELRYKLRMMGVPIDGPAVVWCDNQSVAKGAAVPEAKLNKKHLGICYHAVREASAAKIWQVGFIKGEHNIADCLTKILSGTVLEKQVKQWMYRK